MKFICDDNLGKLAKYLRLMGFDTAFVTPISDSQLLALMLKENRLVITRDNRLIDRIEPGRVILIEHDSPEKQLQQVLKTIDLPIDRELFFSRCLICNEICNDIDLEDVKDKVFPYIVKTKDKFRQCPVCERIFWQGSHYKQMLLNLNIWLKDK
jgi:uncharacterized protein